MSGDAHVRFRERLEVRFPRATRLVILCRRGKAEDALRQLRMTVGRLKLMVNEESRAVGYHDIIPPN